MRSRGNILAELKGGLANQMFQIATGYALAKDHGADFVINYDVCADWHVGKDPKTYQEFYSNIKSSSEDSENVYVEKRFSYDPIPVNPYYLATRNMKIEGYFQAPQYFDRYRDEIQKLFKFPDINLSGIVDENTIGIHIRKGDYLNLPEHNILDIDYFYNAIESMGLGNVIICTDDPEWVKQRFDYSVSPFKTDIEDLYLLSQCKRLILSNSTFSWWSAYLGVEKERVIVPDKWFGDSGPQDYHDIYLQQWEKIPT